MRLLTIAAVAAALIAAGAARATTPSTLPAGSTIAGVDVSGLDAHDATAKLRSTLAPVWERPVTIRIRRHRQQLTTAELGFAPDYSGMVSDAFKQAASNQPVDVPLAERLNRNRLVTAISRLGRPYYRAPRNARIRLGLTHITVISGHWGRALDSRDLTKKLLRELRHPTQARVVAGVVRGIGPPVSHGTLRRAYSTYVSVDRTHFKLRLFKWLRRVKTYPIAVGMAGLETPAGVRHVLEKQVNPAWHVPNRSWAGSLAGETIPPGDPRNPIKARWIGLGDGIGIHGTAEDWSIGHRASHGCIRMHVHDVIALYPRVPIGTPVLIH